MASVPSARSTCQAKDDHHSVRGGVCAVMRKGAACCPIARGAPLEESLVPIALQQQSWKGHLRGAHRAWRQLQEYCGELLGYVLLAVVFDGCERCLLAALESGQVGVNKEARFGEYIAVGKDTARPKVAPQQVRAREASAVGSCAMQERVRGVLTCSIRREAETFEGPAGDAKRVATALASGLERAGLAGLSRIWIDCCVLPYGVGAPRAHGLPL